jgi:tetratricopeptide (TPR) repeat protein
MQQVKEALEIYQQHNDILGQVCSLQHLARLLVDDNQLGVAEEAASQAINLLSGENDQHEACLCYRTLDEICHAKGETETAINHFEAALRIASSFNWHDQQFLVLYPLANLFFCKGRFSDAHAHIECAKSHTVNDIYFLGHAMELQAGFWFEQGRLEEARSEALDAANIYEKLGATRDMEECRKLLQKIEVRMN